MVNTDGEDSKPNSHHHPEGRHKSALTDRADEITRPGDPIDFIE